MIITERINIGKNRKTIEYNITDYKTFLDFYNKNSRNKIDYWKQIPETIKSYLDEILLTDFKIPKRDLLRNEIRKRLLPKSRFKTHINYWLNKGYSKGEAKDKVSELQKVNANKFKLAKKKDPEKYKSILETQLGYWLKKTNGNKQEAKNLLKKRQTTFSKETCIYKFGKNKGIEVFNGRQDKWIDSINNNGNLKCGYSNISQELFNILNAKIKNNNFHYATKNSELKLKKEIGFYLYDFVNIKNKCIIEFNGDMYHANPKLYKSADFPNPFKKELTSKEIWHNDKLKKKLAITNGYKYLVIWESDYLNNKELIINKCIKFLNDEKIYK